MIDYLATLAPEQGLAEAYEIAPPSPPRDLLWRASIRLAKAESKLVDPAPGTKLVEPRVVGAYGTGSSSTLVRATGEAVERYALRPGARPLGAVTGSFAEVSASAPALDFAASALGDPDAMMQSLTWYTARRMRDGRETLIPSGLVDHPEPEAGRWFDCGPSGAASGAGLAGALRSALLETIERDAFMVSWQTQLHLPVLDVQGMLDRPESWERFSRTRRSLLELSRIWRRAQREGLEPLLVDLPTGLPGVVCTLGVVVCDLGPGQVLTVGCKASDDPAESMLGAIGEAMQVRSVVLTFEEELACTADVPVVIVDDEDRLRHLASPAGQSAVRRWVDGFVHERAPRAMTPVTDAAIVEGVCADGAEPLAIDLTGRLPASLVAMGWAAVKVIPAGYQHLRIDERNEFSWNLARLHSAETRTGCVARLPVSSVARQPSTGESLDLGPGPHPLP